MRCFLLNNVLQMHLHHYNLFELISALQWVNSILILMECSLITQSHVPHLTDKWVQHISQFIVRYTVQNEMAPIFYCEINFHFAQLTLHHHFKTQQSLGLPFSSLPTCLSYVVIIIANPCNHMSHKFNLWCWCYYFLGHLQSNEKWLWASSCLYLCLVCLSVQNNFTPTRQIFVKYYTEKFY